MLFVPTMRFRQRQINFRRWSTIRKGWTWIICVLTYLFLSVLFASCKKETTNDVVTPAAKQETSNAGVTNLPAPFGLATDDLEGMLKRRTIRALVVMNPIGFFYANGHPMGAIYEAMRDFQTFVNQKFKTGTLNVQVTFIPVRPDQLEAALTEGVGDLISNGVVVTEERQQRVAFTVPIEKDVRQMVVTGPNFGRVSNLEDLGGKQVYVNSLSVNYQSLQQINDKLQKTGKRTIEIKAADRNLIDDDLLQMVNAGLLPATVTTASRAKLWSQVLPNLRAYPDVIVASGQQTAWVVRKNNPQFKQLLDEFLTPRVVGTSFGNTLLRRYLQNTKWIKNSTSLEEMKKFDALRTIFEQYATQYDFDYLMLMALGYQESLLDQRKRNPSGAVGIMQVIPKYAAASPINVANVNAVAGNIQAGVKMLRNIEDQYFNDPNIDQLDKTLLVFASYNAGPTRISKLRGQARAQGLDPNKWFENVELMVAQTVGQETVTYVGNVYKYYIAYKLAQAQGKIGEVKP
jgi:membrane-bound lytic murein transglycosylase MltF